MNPIDIFIAYAEADKVLMERLRTQLSAAERIGLVDAWHDGEIEIGTNREEASRKAMEEAEIVVLLLSADFFASEYLYEKEMAQALELAKAGKANVIPVLLKECTWQLTPLSQLQVLPKNELPVTNEHWKHPDRAFKNIVDEIIRISNHIRNGEAVPPILKEKSRKKEEVVFQKTVSKTVDAESFQTPLRKLVLYAFAGLAAFALIIFLINFASKPPVDKELVGQKEPAEKTPPSEENSKPPGKTIDLSKVKDLKTNPKITDAIKDKIVVPDLKKDFPNVLSKSKKAPFPSIQINRLEWSSSNINIQTANSWCYQNAEANCAKLGRLYNFKSAKQVCPKGWRLPTKEEWLALSKEDIVKLKLRKGGLYDKGSYRQSGRIGYYFTSENATGDLAWVIEFRGNEIALQKDRRYTFWGMSCRCVR